MGHLFSEKTERNIAIMEVMQQSLLKFITERDLSENISRGSINMHPVGFIREFMTVGFKAPRQTGKSQFIAKQLIKNPNAICVVDIQELKIQMSRLISLLADDIAASPELNSRVLVSRYMKPHLVSNIPFIKNVTHIYMDGITNPVIEEDVINTLLSCGLTKEQAIFINVY